MLILAQSIPFLSILRSPAELRNQEYRLEYCEHEIFRKHHGKSGDSHCAPAEFAR